MDKAHPPTDNPEVSPEIARVAQTDMVYFWIFVLVIFASISFYASVHSPLPADNEPHYMVKAKHYWNPSWCQGDLFLESANAHAVFYQTNGLLTLWLSLEQATQINRLVAHLLFAVGWVALCRALLHSCRAAVPAIWIYLALHAYDNLSGEWVIGGVEGKVYSYGLILLGLSCWLRHRPFCFAICFGLAISFHPIVGLWATSGVLFADVIMRYQQQKWKCLKPAKQDLQTAAILLLFALPGLLPAFQLLLTGTAKEKQIADYLLVYFRLAHHLDPMHFLARGIAFYIALSIPFLLAGQLVRRQPTWLRMWLFLLAALLIALCGLAAGWGPRPAYDMPYYLDRMRLLKFYPFRLYDACLPMMVALLATAAISNWQSWQTHRSKWIPIVLQVFIVGAAIAFTIAVPSKSNQRYEPAMAGWLDACRWIREQTPPDAVIFTPPGNWAFKWYAQRQEYISHKDVPQDAAAIVQWNNRIAFQKELRRNGIGYNKADIAQMRKRGVTHLLVSAQRQVDHPISYRNHWYHIYEIDPLRDLE